MVRNMANSIPAILKACSQEPPSLHWSHLRVLVMSGLEHLVRAFLPLATIDHCCSSEPSQHAAWELEALLLLWV